MNILGIETSCDETAAAVITGEGEILSNVVLSQDEIHAPYGGIVPELASRQHIISISYIVDEGLRRAGLKLSDIDVFAATQGPGLIGSLLVGLSFAKGLAYAMKKPLFPIDHLEAHVHSVFLEHREVPLPALALLVSGGHTSLMLLKEKLQTRLLGRTRDDAAGEALDKISKHLELGYPGGPVIERLARNGNPESFPFGQPRMSDGGLDYSFSGFKTAALRHIREQKLHAGHPRLSDFLASFEQSVVTSLLNNIERALSDREARSLILSGGVARNSRLRRRFEELGARSGIQAFLPAPDFCTDNAAMVAGLALEKIRQGEPGGLNLRLNAYARS
ncbi:MAG: tRNA (adenosine(37)-N6)-threonylcarbamoyltransferase complex transferase subunit TsaD [Candidatus Aminicenantaceae bacterium]